MSIFFLYFFSYFLSFTGYLLGKATEEEHKEIKNYVRYIIEGLIFITYIIAFYLFRNSLIAFFFVVLLILKLLSFKFKIYNLKGFHNVLLFGFSMLYFRGDYIYFSFLPLMAIFFEKSFLKFNWHREAYEFLFLIIVYILVKIWVSG